MESNKRGSIGLRLLLDPDGFAAAERLLTYEMVNALLLINVELQQLFNMKPLELQIFMLISTSSMQRFMRDPQRDRAYHDVTPLPAKYRGSISRRRIAESLDLPLETVRRNVANLIARGVIVETGRGLLSTSQGTLKQSSETGVTLLMASRFLRLANRMIQFDAATLGVERFKE